MNIHFRYPIHMDTLIGLKVAIYKNLHEDKWSCKALEGDYKNKVIFHIDEITLDSASFHVSVAGQERVRKEKRKHVHAVVKGRINSLSTNNALKLQDEIYYNPYTTDTFINKNTSEVIVSAEKVHFNTAGKVFLLEGV